MSWGKHGPGLGVAGRALGNTASQTAINAPAVPRATSTRGPEDPAVLTETSAGGPGVCAPRQAEAKSRCRYSAARGLGHRASVFICTWTLPRAVHGGEGQRLGTGRTPPARQNPREPAHPSFRPGQTSPGPRQVGCLSAVPPSRTPSCTAAPHPALGAARSLSVRTWGPAPQAPRFCPRELPGFPSELQGSRPPLAQPHGPCSVSCVAPLHGGRAQVSQAPHSTPGPRPPAPRPQTHGASLPKP